jgi:hypothetical protein
MAVPHSLHLSPELMAISYKRNSVETLLGAPALWSAATCHRFFRLADLSVKQHRPCAQGQGAKPTEPTIRGWIVGHSTFDGHKSPAESGDESPHSKGFASRAITPFFKQASTNSDSTADPPR